METQVEKTEIAAQSAEAENGSRKEQIVNIDYKMVTFSLAGKDYAIDIMKVKEIAKAGRFTYVPNTAPFVLGVYNLRGDIIPIVDLRLFFNIEIPERKEDDLENMLIVVIEDQTFGVVVDAIDKVVGIHSSSIQPPHPLFGDINIKYIYGIVESNDRLYVLLDIDRIFGSRSSRTDADAEEKKIALVNTPPAEFEQAEQQSAQTPVRQAAVSEEPNVDFSFVIDSLGKLKKFFVTSVNEMWVKARFSEWVKERGAENVQLQSEQDAEAFLKPFLSGNTGALWSEQYINAVYKSLPENSARQIMVWNPGCGKGFEAYSLACLLKKRYPSAKIKIYAQDIDLLCVSNAPLLTVPERLAVGWYAPYLTQKVSGEYTFSQEIKDMVLFEYHDCMNATSMPVVDVIFARDILSSLAPDAQKNLLAEFAEKLKGNGILIVGEHESLAGISGWSEHTENNMTFYTKQ